MYAELVDNATVSERLKVTRLFHYASTAQDLLDGTLVELDLATTTYGLGHAVKIGSAEAAIVVGPVDHAVTAATLSDYTGGTGVTPTDPGGKRMIRVVVHGYKADVATDGNVVAADPITGGATGYAYRLTAASLGMIGIALETDGGSPTTADCWIYPRYTF